MAILQSTHSPQSSQSSSPKSYIMSLPCLHSSNGPQGLAHPVLQLHLHPLHSLLPTPHPWLLFFKPNPPPGPATPLSSPATCVDPSPYATSYTSSQKPSLTIQTKLEPPPLLQLQTPSSPSTRPFPSHRSSQPPLVYRFVNLSFVSLPFYLSSPHHVRQCLGHS